MRNLMYDNVNHNLGRLAQTMEEKSSIIEKSEAGKDDYQSLINSMGEIIYGQFLQLKKDFELAKINQAMYVSYLRLIADELTKNDFKIDVETLHVGEIAKEIKRYINIK